jgi:hypothetical protein
MEEGSIGIEGMNNDVIDKRIEPNKLHDVSHSIAIFTQAVYRLQYVVIRLTQSNREMTGYLH